MLRRATMLLAVLLLAFPPAAAAGDGVRVESENGAGNDRVELQFERTSSGGFTQQYFYVLRVNSAENFRCTARSRIVFHVPQDAANVSVDPSPQGTARGNLCRGREQPGVTVAPTRSSAVIARVLYEIDGESPRRADLIVTLEEPPEQCSNIGRTGRWVACALDVGFG